MKGCEKMYNNKEISKQMNKFLESDNDYDKFVNLLFSSIEINLDIEFIKEELLNSYKDDNERVCEIYLLMSRYYFQGNNNYAKSLGEVEKALKYSDVNKKGELYYYKCKNLEKLGDYKEALKYLYKAFELGYSSEEKEKFYIKELKNNIK